MRDGVEVLLQIARTCLWSRVRVCVLQSSLIESGS